MDTEHSMEKVGELLSVLRDSSAARARAGMNAASCRTKSDWKRAHEAEDSEEAAFESALSGIRRELEHAYRAGSRAGGGK